MLQGSSSMTNVRCDRLIPTFKGNEGKQWRG